MHTNTDRPFSGRLIFVDYIYSDSLCTTNFDGFFFNLIRIFWMELGILYMWLQCSRQKCTGQTVTPFLDLLFRSSHTFLILFGCIAISKRPRKVSIFNKQIFMIYKMLCQFFCSLTRLDAIIFSCHVHSDELLDNGRIRNVWYIFLGGRYWFLSELMHYSIGNRREKTRSVYLSLSFSFYIFLTQWFERLDWKKKI